MHPVLLVFVSPLRRNNPRRDREVRQQWTTNVVTSRQTQYPREPVADRTTEGPKYELTSGFLFRKDRDQILVTYEYVTFFSLLSFIN